MNRDIAAEILEGLEDAAAYLDGRKNGARVTVVNIPEPINGRRIRQFVRIANPDFSIRYCIPLEKLRKWERGTGPTDVAAIRVYRQRSPRHLK